MLYYKFGSGEISNLEIKQFVKLKNSGWYQTIKNKIYGKNKFTPSTKFLGDLIVFNDDEDITFSKHSTMLQSNSRR